MGLFGRENMGAIGRIKPDTAKFNPESVFAGPLDVVNEVMFTRGEKIATLERWRQSIFMELNAANEGMQTRGTSSTKAKVLQDIDEAIKRLVRPEHTD
jgi:hypothetical protein